MNLARLNARPPSPDPLAADLMLGLLPSGCANAPVRALSDYSLAELEAAFAASGHKPSHAAAVLRAFYAHGRDASFGHLLLPKALAAAIEEARGTELSTPVARQQAADGTLKLLMRLADTRTVEAVLMPDYRADRAAGCVSSQVGCAMGCDFCATTKTGFERNLSAGEIVEQFLALRREAAAQGRRLQTLVFMGMGEPMLNLDAVTESVRRIAGNRIGALGWRQVTVSTVGIVPGIDALAESGLGVHLAVSLHAPDDATRARLLPMGKRFGVGDILAAADRYRLRTGRPVTIQYCLLEGVNDSPEQARQLAALVAGRGMHVNLLRYNPTGLSLRGVTYSASSEARAAAFAAVLKADGAVAHCRRSRGKDIDAACGQLRLRAAAS